MEHRKHEPPARHEDTARLAHCAQVERVPGKREVRRVGDDVLTLRVRIPCGADQGR
ncbi:hypothetical protein [Amycolatopsis alkalitolerans]|uniref:hypothetical protein n=1 Tax=Amycolatopsis alkalitolerans TaxID=2547244 RepID=UPI00135B5FE6|nr:hypothetical protein [Amycolatopsis alkalitolerans]